MMRGMVPKVLFTVWVLSCAAAPVIGERTDPGFPSNLGVLSQLADDAVSALLDSLDIQPGEKITVVSAGFNEGNDFIASALARDLALRGVEVRLATETPAPPQGSASSGAQQEGDSTADSASVSSAAEADSAGAAADTLAAGASADSTFGFPRPTGSPDTLSAGEGAGGETGEAAKNGAEEKEAEVMKPEEEEKADQQEGAGSTAEGGQQAEPTPAQLAPTVKPYPEGMVLEYRVLEFGVTYPILKRRFLLFGDASVRRLGGVYLAGSRIRGPEGTILKVAKGQSHEEDYLSSRARVRAEGASYPFTKPVVPPANVGKYFEPVAVAGIITSLVYLFYQNQN